MLRVMAPFVNGTVTDVASARAGGLSVVEVGGGVGVAPLGITRLVADGEPVLALFGRAMREAIGSDPAGRLFLNPVIAYRICRRQRIVNVLVGQRLQVWHARALLLDRRCVVCPHTGVAVGLQLGANPVAQRALRALLGPADVAEQILHMVAEFVRDDVLLRQMPTAGT